MVTLSELLSLNDRLTVPGALSTVLGDAFLLENCLPYRDIRRLMLNDRFVRVEVSNSHPYLGWPLWRVENGANTNLIYCFDNTTALRQIVASIGENHSRFTIETYDYKDILGNTVVIEYAFSRLQRYLNGNPNRLSSTQMRIMRWVFGFTLEMWIGVHCHTQIAQWFSGLNLFFRNLCRLSDMTSDIDGTPIEEFFELHLYEFLKCIYNHASGQHVSKGEVSELTLHALSCTQHMLMQIANFVLSADKDAQSNLMTSLEDLIEIVDEPTFKKFLVGSA